MIDEATLAALIRTALPDADVEVTDLTGTMDHLSVFVRSRAFAGLHPLDRHRMVEGAVKPARSDGRLHALAIRTAIKE